MLGCMQSQAWLGGALEEFCSPLCWAVETFSIGLFMSANPATTSPHLKVGAQKWTVIE